MTSSSEPRGTVPRAAVAVGVFDGLHLGHQQLLQRAIDLARARHGRAVVVTFDPHPDVVLGRVFRPVAPLTPVPEKRERLRAMGIDVVEVLPFTRELASLSPEEFVDRHLVSPFRLHDLVVGQDFALGKGRAGNVVRLKEIGATRDFEVHSLPLFEYQGGPVTSSRIRGLLELGQVAPAARLLGRLYDLEGRVVTGEGIGRTLDCPTANLRLHDEKLVPGNGIYAAWASVDGERERRPAAMSVGVRPTFGGQDRAIEVHLIDWSGDLVDRTVRVEFADWLRPELRFESAEALKVAIAEDLSQIRRMLAAAAAAD